MATPARIRAAWAPTAPCRTCRTTAQRACSTPSTARSWRSWPAAGPRSVAPLRGPDADRRRTCPARVQRAVRGPRDAGDPATARSPPRADPPRSRPRRSRAATVGATARGTLPTFPGATVAVVLAAAGYPGAPRRGDAIDGLADAARPARWSSMPARSGTRTGRSGPRAAGCSPSSAVVRDLASAAALAADAADRIRATGLQRRTDIGRPVAATTVEAYAR